MTRSCTDACKLAHTWESRSQTHMLTHKPMCSAACHVVLPATKKEKSCGDWTLRQPFYLTKQTPRCLSVLAFYFLSQALKTLCKIVKAQPPLGLMGSDRSHALLCQALNSQLKPLKRRREYELTWRSETLIRRGWWKRRVWRCSSYYHSL